MKKIVLVLPCFSSQQWDSQAEQAWNIARNLTADGWAQCCILASRLADEPALELKNDVPIHRFTPERSRWGFLRKYWQDDFTDDDVAVPGMELFLQKNQFDLVHIMVGGRLCERLAAVLQERNIPYVVSCRSGEFRIFDAAQRGRSRSHSAFTHYLRSYHGALRNAGRVLCSDQRLRRMLAQRLGDRQVECWQMGVEPERFSRLSPLNFKEFYQIPASRHIVLTIGRIGESGNQKMLLETLSMLNSRNWNCQLVMIGWCSSARYMKSFMDLAVKCRMENYLTVIPGFPPGDERFAAAFQAASLVILPARYEVSGTAVLEAWSAGVPVIASPAGAAADLIEDNVSGRLVMMHDFQACVRCCEELLDERNRTRLEKMRSTALAQARNFRWKNCLDKLVGIYEDVMKIA